MVVPMARSVLCTPVRSGRPRGPPGLPASVAPHLRAGPCSRAAAAGAVAAAASSPSSGAAPSSPPIGPLFDSLAELLSPGCALTAGATPLGRGLLTKGPAPRGTQLLAIDWCNMLCVTLRPELRGDAFSRRVLDDWQALHGPLPPLLYAYLTASPGSDWFLRLTALQLWVLKHGGGVWPAYAQLVPRGEELTALMNMPPELAQQQLQDPRLVSAAAAERQAILGLHDRIFSSSTGDLAALRLADTAEETLRAASLVNSRSFCETVDGGEVVALVVPLIDMANHSGAPNAAFQYSEASACFELRALRDLAAGEEVCISYLGSTPNKDNLALMKAYGFVVQGNTSERLEFSAGDDVASRLGGGAPAERPTLSPDAFAAAMRSFPVGSGSSDAEQRAAAFGRQRAVQASLQPLMTARKGASGGLQAAAAAAQQQAERQAVAYLLRQCSDMAAQFVSSIEQDEALLSSSKDMDPRLWAAVSARLERKRLVRTATQMLQHYDTYLQHQPAQPAQ